MKYSMMSYTMAGGKWGENPDIEYLCKLTRNLGLDGIEWVGLYGRRADEVKEIMDDYGLKTVCYTFFVDINFKDENLRRHGIEQIKRGIEESKVLATDKIMLPIGGKDEYSRDESRENVIKGLEEVIGLADNYGISITVEQFPDIRGPFLNSEDMKKIIKEIPQVKVTFDSGNVILGGEEPSESFLKMKEYVIHTHFKDWEISNDGKEGLDGKKYIPALIGEGIIDYKKLVKTMEKENYLSYVSIEYEGYKYDREEAIIKALNFLKNIK
ncbi:MAG TPA: sugar phosphate isomerase/epimerase family protein [bacterium]|nr:sugar phosphate isomerase/epimerase family protein [bacterium]